MGPAAPLLRARTPRPASALPRFSSASTACASVGSRRSPTESHRRRAPQLRRSRAIHSHCEDFSMKSKQHWLAFAAMIALGSALGLACGDDPEETDLCADVECIDAATTCDPIDGICKCGTGDDRITCKSNEICQTEPNPACLQDRC